MDPKTQQQLYQTIETIPPRPHHHALLASANEICQDCSFKHVLSKGGWYRVGAVLSSDGHYLDADLETWVNKELTNCGEDFEKFLSRYIDAGLIVTRYAGRTHYFVSVQSSAPEDFLQLEVEELQELYDRPLIDPEQPPTDRTSLVEPISPVKLNAHAVGNPHYRVARMSNVSDLTHQGEANALQRFMSEWSQSRACDHGHFSDYWIIANLDRYDPNKISVYSPSLMSIPSRTLASFQWDTDKTGVELGNQIRDFDRAAGYPGAWYFHVVANRFVPESLTTNIRHDIKSGYEYLAAKDWQLLRSFVSSPYSVNSIA